MRSLTHSPSQVNEQSENPSTTPPGPNLLGEAPQSPLEGRWAKVQYFFRRFGRLILLALGAVAIFGLVSAIGPEKIWAALARAGIWLPLILLLDFSWLFFEHFAVRVLSGKDARKVPLRTWLETTLLHYVTFMLVPMGRTSAEVTRATLLSKPLGRSRAATIAALMQSLTMVANAVVTVLALVVLLWFADSPALLWGLAINVCVTGAIGVGGYLVMRHANVGRFLGKRFTKLAEAGPEMDVHFRASARRHFPALLVCLFARVIQTGQFAVVLLAIVGHTSVSAAIIAEGIQLVGRSAGDMVPNQVGITEGAFTLFSDALRLQHDPALAVSVALLVRVSNLSVAGLCALLLQFRPRRLHAAA